MSCSVEDIKMFLLLFPLITSYNPCVWMWWRHYLLTQWAVAKLLQAVELIGLTQERVEGLCCPMDCGGVGRDREGSNQAHLLQGGVTTSRLIQELVILQVFGESLQHRQRLVEVNLSRVMKKTWEVQFPLSPSWTWGSQTLTGMGILESSFPIQFFMMLHRLRE